MAGDEPERRAARWWQWQRGTNRLIAGAAIVGLVLFVALLVWFLMPGLIR